MKGDKANILSDLLKSGFPAEIYISSTLEQQEWMVYNSSLFFDKEESKEREIDIHAVKVDDSFINRTPTKVGLGDVCKSISHLIIEVKKCKKPLIFFQYGREYAGFFPNQTFKSKKERFHHLSLDDIDSVYASRGDLFTRKETLKFYGLIKHRYKENPLHKTFYMAFPSPSQPNQVYEAVKKTYKALMYQKSRYGNGAYVLHIFYPIVVVDGDLWSAKLDKKGNINLEKVEHLLLEVKQLISGEKGRQHEEEQIYDIVSRRGFNKFLTLIKKDNLSLYHAWSNFIQLKRNNKKLIGAFKNHL